MTDSIYSPGSVVKIGPANARIEGIIIQVSIRQNYHHTYQIAWWEGANRRCEWFEPCEVEASTSDIIDIGFHAIGMGPCLPKDSGSSKS